MRLLSILASLLGAAPYTGALGGKSSDPRQHLAFVLLQAAELPRPEDVLSAYRILAPPEEQVLGAPEVKDGGLSFQVGKDGFAVVGMMPVPVPNGEAAAAFERSFSSGLAEYRELRPHTAHLVVVLNDAGGRTRYQGLTRFTYLLAAVARASNAVAIYWGAAHATHDARYFLDRAEQRDPDLMMGLWTGLEITREGSDRLSVVTCGMRDQLGLMELRVTAPLRSGEASVLRMFDFLAYAARRGAALPDGDTIGRDANERLKVRHERSAGDPKQKVWRIDFP